MSDDPPNPLTDVRKGLGLLFRAAWTTAKKLPTKDIEASLVSSAREVGQEVRRAFGNVATTIERELRGKSGASAPPISTARPDDQAGPGESGP